jgi:tRNA (guanine-N7-)-methyltransferase
MRLRNVTDARKNLEMNPELVALDPARHKGRWKKLFGNANPIFLEIGAGKGQFLCNISEQFPDINFLGLEKHDSVLFRALQRLTDIPRQNVMLLRGEAENLLDYFDVNEIERIYLNFPDPWLKKGDAKKRLTHAKFLDKYQYILTLNGKIHIKTDSQEFFEFTLQHINEYGMKFDYINLDLHTKEPERNVRTEYEASRSATGSTIYMLLCSFRQGRHTTAR